MNCAGCGCEFFPSKKATRFCNDCVKKRRWKPMAINKNFKDFRIVFVHRVYRIGVGSLSGSAEFHLPQKVLDRITEVLSDAGIDFEISKDD